MSRSPTECTALPPAVADSSTSSQPIDPRALRNTLGRFATGVAVVTAVDPDGHPIGLTVNSFSAVSLEPPLVLWCLAENSHNVGAFRAASHHCINILSADQMDISNRFATWPVDRFAGLHWHPGRGGAPRIDGSCAHFEVRNEVQHVAGDHVVFITRVEAFGASEDLPPLLFFGGRYRYLAGE